MIELLTNIDTILSSLLESLGLYGPIFGSILILVESMLPILPLSVFITINFYTFGNLFGFFISYILTVIGCNLAFYISRKVFKGRINYLTKKYDKNTLLNLMKTFADIKFSHLALLMAFPFTPAFAINILSGTSNMNYNKFLIASILGKPFMVYFWGYVGVTLLESLTHPAYFIKIVLILLVAYALSSIVNKKFKLD